MKKMLMGIIFSAICVNAVAHRFIPEDADVIEYWCGYNQSNGSYVVCQEGEDGEYSGCECVDNGR